MIIVILAGLIGGCGVGLACSLILGWEWGR